MSNFAKYGIAFMVLSGVALLVLSNNRNTATEFEDAAAEIRVGVERLEQSE